MCDFSIVQTEDVRLHSFLWFAGSGIDYPLLCIVKLQKSMSDLNIIFWVLFSSPPSIGLANGEFRKMFILQRAMKQNT